MKRIHLVEFEDLEWFPSWLRACMTRLIIVFMRVVGGERVLQHQIALALEATGEQDVVDLGSGAGGSMPVVLEALRAKGQMQSLTLTDLYPNPETIAHLEARNIEGLRYHPEPVDATDLATAPAGLKTMINSFHHMRPEQARDPRHGQRKRRAVARLRARREQAPEHRLVALSPTRAADHGVHRCPLHSIRQAADFAAALLHVCYPRYPILLRVGWASLDDQDL